MVMTVEFKMTSRTMTPSCGKEIDLPESILNCNRDRYQLAKYGSPLGIEEVRGDWVT